MPYQYEKELITELAAEIKAAGYRVFIAERGTYGFYTDTAGSRVVSFQIDLGVIHYGGNYKTNRPQQCGTGWRLDTADFGTMFNQCAPRWAVGDASWQFTTLEQHLKAYQSSSKYQEYQLEIAAQA